MTLYEIDQRISELADPETGELMDYEAFAELQMERNMKIEGIACWVKNLSADVAGYEAEIETLTKRKEKAKATIEKLKGYLMQALNGEKFSTTKCVVSFWRSKKCVPDTRFVQWAQENDRDDLLNYKEPTVSLTKVKEAVGNGENVPAKIVESISVVVK